MSSPVLLERFRESKEYRYLAQLIAWDHQINDENLSAEFTETFKSLQDSYLEKRLEGLLIKFKTGQLDATEKAEYVALMSALKN